MGAISSEIVHLLLKVKLSLQNDQRWLLLLSVFSKKEDQLSLNAGQKYCRTLQEEHSTILLTFMKLPFDIKVFVLSLFEWLLKIGFTITTTYMYFLLCGVHRLAVI